MKIAQVHNFYQNPTGDDSVVKEEKKLLEINGHSVLEFTKSNKILSSASIYKKIRLGLDLKSSNAIAKEFTSFINEHKPDLVHAHNIFPLITPVIFKVCHENHLPVVQTLHNYRLVCVNTLLYRDGHLCQDCIDSSLAEGVKNKCYNGSKVQSYLMASALEHHRKVNTWNQYVDYFISLSDFARSKFIKGGINEGKIVVKPNFVTDPMAKPAYKDYWLFAGKLEEQKGLYDFLELVKAMPHVNFKVAGYSQDPSLFDKFKNIVYLGVLEREKLMQYMSDCKGVLFLSKMYEGMPMTILEAFSHQKVVIARNQGAMKEMIVHGENGFLFNNGLELKNALEKLESVVECRKMGQVAYGSFLEKYNEKDAYRRLFGIYQLVLSNT